MAMEGDQTSGGGQTMEYTDVCLYVVCLKFM